MIQKTSKNIKNAKSKEKPKQWGGATTRKPEVEDVEDLEIDYEQREHVKNGTNMTLNFVNDKSI